MKKITLSTDEIFTLPAFLQIEGSDVTDNPDENFSTRYSGRRIATAERDYPAYD